MHVIRGLYAVTPDEQDTGLLVAALRCALLGGAGIVQYRNKSASPSLRLAQALQLKRVCDEFRVPLIINDHVELALEVDAAGVHLGSEDGGIRNARSRLGPHKLLGASCYDRIELAVQATRDGADHVAFGSFFVSSVKPGAVRAPLRLLQDARRLVSVPLVAIGGITLDNGAALVKAGADALAVISALFGAPDVEQAARAFNNLYRTRT